NMLAGAGGIQAVLLVIAADEGIRAQTREHLDICSLLGIERGIVVLTKADAVDSERLDKARQQVTACIQGTFLGSAPLLVVSAKTGHGIPELRAAVAEMAAALPTRGEGYVPRLPPDRAFAMRGFGTVVTGTLQSGSLRAGSTLELLPEARTVRVRGIQVHGDAVGEVAAPSRVALNVSGIEHGEVHRGHTLVPPDTLAAATVVDAEIVLLPDAPALKHRAKVRMHAFAADIEATVLLYESEQTSDGTALVRLQLAAPLVLLPGDRFVLRQPSPAATIGGGRVLDASCVRELKKSQTLRWLQQIRGASPEEQVLLRVARRSTAGLHIDDIVRETGLTAEAIRPVLAALTERKEIVAASNQFGFLIPAEPLAQAEAALLRLVSESKTGSVARAELRTRARLSEAAFELAVRRLLERKALTGQEALSLPGRGGPEAAQQSRLDAVEREYARAGTAPPLVREVAERLRLSESQMRECVTLLVRGGRLLRLGSDDLFIHCEALAQLRANLKAHRGESFDVARFKSFTGLTRKHAIPLLELLDRTGATRNQAGTRIVL
ncbi:MAG TPA: SelB C-terminal domain-containing protein, partial [Acidobacteriaceae bacterium]|nr:SelB C-terminal domain-containing protein [Acidobacteriaceae bacterium]